VYVCTCVSCVCLVTHHFGTLSHTHTHTHAHSLLSLSPISHTFTHPLSLSLVIHAHSLSLSLSLCIADATSVAVLRNLAWARLALTSLADLLSAPLMIRGKLAPSPAICKAVSHFMSESSSDTNTTQKVTSDTEWTKRLHLFLFKVLDRSAGFQVVCLLCVRVFVSVVCVCVL